MCNICLLNIWPLTVILTLSWHMGNMGSAHPLVEVNLSFKMEGNPFIGKGVIERTRIGDRRTDGPTDRHKKRFQYSPPTFRGGGIIKELKSQLNVKNKLGIFVDIINVPQNVCVWLNCKTCYWTECL